MFRAVARWFVAALLGLLGWLFGTRAEVWSPEWPTPPNRQLQALVVVWTVSGLFLSWLKGPYRVLERIVYALWLGFAVLILYSELWPWSCLFGALTTSLFLLPPTGRHMRRAPLVACAVASALGAAVTFNMAGKSLPSIEGEPMNNAIFATGGAEAGELTLSLELGRPVAGRLALMDYEACVAAPGTAYLLLGGPAAPLFPVDTPVDYVEEDGYQPIVTSLASPRNDISEPATEMLLYEISDGCARISGATRPTTFAANERGFAWDSPSLAACDATSVNSDSTPPADEFSDLFPGYDPFDFDRAGTDAAGYFCGDRYPVRLAVSTGGPYTLMESTRAPTDESPRDWRWITRGSAGRGEQGLIPRMTMVYEATGFEARSRTLNLWSGVFLGLTTGLLVELLAGAGRDHVRVVPSITTPAPTPRNVADAEHTRRGRAPRTGARRLFALAAAALVGLVAWRRRRFR